MRARSRRAENPLRLPPVAPKIYLAFVYPLPKTHRSTHIQPPARAAQPFNSSRLPDGKQSFKPFTFARSLSPPFFSKNNHRHRLNIPPPNSSKGLLPLPRSFPLSPASDPGWTTVSYRKKPRRPPQTPSAPYTRPHPKCFFCHSSSHMARDCPQGGFICFSCHGKGHISKDCPQASRASVAAPILPVPEDTAILIQDLSSYAIFYLAQGNPSVAELREMLSFRFDVRDWSFPIKRAAGSSFMVQFPTPEVLDQALALKIVDMGSFKGRFLRWREDLRLTTLPKPFLIWVRIFRLPYHLWQWEFLLSLFKDVGECVMCSNDVSFRSNLKDCKVLIKVRDLSDIPKQIKFRYVSPDDGNLMEGFIVTQLLGSQILERDFEKSEVQEHAAKWEGNPSTESGWVDRGPEEEDVDQLPQIRRPPLPSLGVDQDPDLIDMMWDGRNLSVDKSQWMSFLKAHGIGTSETPALRRPAADARPGASTSKKSLKLKKLVRSSALQDILESSADSNSMA